MIVAALMSSGSAVSRGAEAAGHLCQLALSSAAVGLQLANSQPRLAQDVTATGCGSKCSRQRELGQLWGQRSTRAWVGRPRRASRLTGPLSVAGGVASFGAPARWPPSAPGRRVPGGGRAGAARRAWPRAMGAEGDSEGAAAAWAAAGASHAAWRAREGARGAPDPSSRNSTSQTAASSGAGPGQQLGRRPGHHCRPGAPVGAPGSLGAAQHRGGSAGKRQACRGWRQGTAPAGGGGSSARRPPPAAVPQPRLPAAVPSAPACLRLAHAPSSSGPNRAAPPPPPPPPCSS